MVFWYLVLEDGRSASFSVPSRQGPWTKYRWSGRSPLARAREQDSRPCPAQAATMLQSECAWMYRRPAGRSGAAGRRSRCCSASVAVQPACVVHDFDTHRCAAECSRRLHRHASGSSVEPNASAVLSPMQFQQGTKLTPCSESRPSRQRYGASSAAGQCQHCQRPSWTKTSRRWSR